MSQKIKLNIFRTDIYFLKSKHLGEKEVNSNCILFLKKAVIFLLPIDYETYHIGQIVSHSSGGIGNY